MEGVNKYRLMINLMEYIDDKLNEDTFSEESKDLLMNIKKIILNEIKN